MSTQAPENEFDAYEIVDRTEVATGLHRIRVQVAEDRAAGYTVPGQYVKMKVPGDDKVGYFVIASAPGEGSPFSFFIKEGGGAADRILSRQAGETVEVSAVQGGGYPLADHVGRPVLLLGIGSGLAALRPVVDHLLGSADGPVDVIIGYGSRSTAESAFQDDLERWEAAGIQVLRSLSQPEEGYAGPRGYIQERLTADHVKAGPVICLCGTKDFEKGVLETLAGLGLAEPVILKNY